MVTDINKAKKLPFWDKLSDGEKEFVQLNSNILDFSVGQLLHSCSAECMGMLLLLHGEIRVSILSEEGREITLYRLYENDLCAMTASCILDQITFDTQMTAAAECTALVIGTPAFEKLMQDNIYVRCFMYELLSERFSSVMWTMQMILFKGFDRRLASFLISEYRRTGLTTIRMTHDQIAEYTNSAREVVARMLKRFAADGVVEFKRGIISLKDIDALKNML